MRPSRGICGDDGKPRIYLNKNCCALLSALSSLGMLFSMMGFSRLYPSQHLYISSSNFRTLNPFAASSSFTRLTVHSPR